MKRATMIAPGRIELSDVPVPSPGPGEVLLRIRRIGVCGSDVHVNHGRHPFTTYPVIQGHEFSGVVEQVGEGAGDIRPGQKVTATPQVTCGECRSCRRGDYHICERLAVQGFQAPGCAQDYFITRAERVVPLPESFSFEQGAFVEPVSVGVHAVSRVPSLRDKNVAVIGAGPIGNLLSQVAQAEGARVLLTDVSDFRLHIARTCGVEFVANTATTSLAAAASEAFGRDGFDVAFECSGVESALTEAVASIQKGGSIVLVAVYGEPIRVNTALVQDRELRLIGTLMYQRSDFVRAVELLESGRVNSGPLETEHFPLDAFQDAYAFIDRSRDRSMKVFIDL